MNGAAACDKNNTLVKFFYDQDPMRVDQEFRLRQQSDKYDPEKPPRWKPGDIYILIGTIAGMIIGGGLGTLITNNYIYAVVGLVAGGIIGATIGSYVKKWRRSDKKPPENPV